jgi:protein-tyrosine-phosphatase
VRSAGFVPAAGRRSPTGFARIAAGRGVDLAGHRSRVVGPEDLGWADVVLLMDRKNHRNLATLDGTRADEALWLGVLTGDGEHVEIEDPLDMPAAATEAVLDRIDRAVGALAAAVRSP